MVGFLSLNYFYTGTVVVIQLEDWGFPITEDLGSNRAINFFL